MFDMNRLEIIDLENPANPIEWTGTVDEFTAANVDCPMTEEELWQLTTRGYVILGGGAVPMVCVRYALNNFSNELRCDLDIAIREGDIEAARWFSYKIAHTANEMLAMVAAMRAKGEIA